MFKRTRHQQRKSSNGRKASPAAAPIRLQALEQRVLLDAAAAQTAVQMAEQAHAPVPADASSAELMHALENASAHAVAPVEAHDAATSTQAAAKAAPVNVYFVDGALPDADQLIQSLGENAEVHVLDTQSDGVLQIAQTLQGRHDVDAIHILSHGSAGQLALGAATLDAAGIDGAYKAVLQDIGQSLGENGDILIYGCDFAAGDRGAAAEKLLSEGTGADVAASTDMTGAASLGADWVLERQVGEVDAKAVSAANWDHVLASNVVAMDTKAPTIAGPTSASGAEDSVIAIPGVKVSNGGADVSATLSVPVGTGRLTVADGTSVSITGNGTETVVLKGSVVDVNAVLAGLTFTPKPDSNVGSTGGPVSLQLTVQDMLPADVIGALLPRIEGTPGVEKAPDGWQVSNDTPDVIKGNGPWPNSTPTLITISDVGGTSADGGSMALMLGPVSGAPGESISTTLSGLTAGQDYAVAVQWQQATLNSYGTVYTGGELIMGVDGITTTFTSNGTAASDGWQTAIVRFTATGTEAKLSLAVSQASSTNGHAIVVDAGGFALSSQSKSISITVTAVQDPPVITDPGVAGQSFDPSTGNFKITTNEDTAVTGRVSATDADGDTLSYTASKAPANGTVTVKSDGSYTYTPSANFNGSDSFTVQVDDGHGNKVLSVVTVTVNPVNDAPVLADTVLTFTTQEDAPAPSGAVGSSISTLTGGISDVDAGAVKGIAITATSPTNGTWWYTIDGGNTWQTVGTVSAASSLLLADNAQTRLYFQATKADYNGTGGATALTLRAWDQTSGTNGSKVSTSTTGGTSAFSTATDTVAVTIAPVNDAPVLTDTNRALSTINEDNNSTTPWGVPSGAVGTAVNAGFAGGITDVDSGALSGIAITAADTSNGTWYYTTDNGVTWQAMGAVSENNALLLANTANSRVYFRANADYNGTLANALTIRAWDQTSGSNGGRADASANGGASAFSTFADAVGLTVNSIADIVADSVKTNEDTPVTFNPLTGAGGTSGADSFENSGARITAVAGLAIVPGGAAVAVPNGTVTLAADGVTLTFTPNADYNGNSVFSYTVTSAGTTETANITVTVAAVGDAPRIDLDVSTAGTGYEASYDQDGVAIGNLVSITDPEGDNLTSMTIKIVGATSADKLQSSGLLPTGLTANYNAATGVFTIAGNSSLANYQAALGMVRFVTTLGTVESRTIQVSAVSAAAPTASNVAVATITLLDTDGDGVANAADIDDDNDGVLDTVESPLPPSLIDGSMEGAFNVAWEENTNPSSLNSTVEGTGWTRSLGSPDTWKGPFSLNGAGYWGGAMNGVPGAAEGDVFMALYNGFMNEGISRQIPVSAGVKVGDLVQIDFQQIFGGVNGITAAGQTANFVFTIDGVSYDASTLTYEGNVAKQWSKGSIQFVATTDSPKIAITIKSVGEGCYLGIDAVEVRRVADILAFADPDHDGIVNRLDIDSDNDGITDNVEAQTTQGYKPPSGQGAAMVDADHDGLDDAYDANTADKSAAASKGLTPVDTDGDKTVDYLDSDSDNDGMLDVAERGDGQPTSITSTGDSDKDGLLDIFEGANVNDGFDVNDENLVGGNFHLADTDGDVAANGSNATPLSSDFDYRDNQINPLIDLNSVATGSDTSRDNTVSAVGGAGAVKVAAAAADVNDFGGNDLTAMRIAVGGVKDGANEIVNIGGADFALDADSTRTVTVGGTTFTVAYTVAGGFVISNAAGGAMSQSDLDAMVRGISYQDTLSHATDGDRTLSFTVSNGVATSAAAVATIHVTHANTAPVANSEMFSGIEDQTLSGNVLANDSDPDGDALSVSGFSVAGDATVYAPGSTATIAGVGSVTIAADGSFTFTPAPNYNGLGPKVSYTVDDGFGGSASAMLIIDKVVSVNDAPVAADDAIATPEDTAVTLDLLANDSDVEDGKPVIQSINGEVLTGGAQMIVVPHGTVEIDAAGVMKFVPEADYNGPVSFAYTVVDSQGLSGTGNVAIVVSAANDAPVVTDPGVPGQTVDPDTGEYAIRTDEDTQVDGQIGATDVDGDEISYTVGMPPAHGTVVVNPDGSYTYTPATDFNGNDSFVVTVDDGQGGTASVTVNVTVNPVNDEPVAKDDAYSVVEDGSVDLDLLANDSDVEDGKPTIASINGEALTGGAQTIVVPNGQVVIDAAGTMTFVPDANYNGTVSFDYEVMDSEGASHGALVTIEVASVNDVPTITDPGVPGQTVDPDTGDYAISTDEETPVEGAIGAVDDDGDSLSYTLDNGPAHGTVVLNPDGSYTYTPGTDFNGDDSFVVTVDDGQGGKTNVMVNVTVNPVNDDPVSGDDSLVTAEDQPITLDLLANDSDVEDGQPTIESINGEPLTGGEQTIDVPNGQVLIAADGTMQFVPAPDYNGPVDFVYVAVDSEGAQVSGNVHIDVTPVQDAPVVVDPNVPGQNFDPATGETSITTPEDQPVDGQVVATDADGDDLSYTVTEGPSHGTLVIDPDTGAYTYTPDPDFNGEDHFTVAVDDGNGNVVEAPVNVTVTPVEDAPVVVDPNVPGQNFDPTTGETSITTPEDQPVDGQVVATDADGDDLSYALVDGPAHGAVVLDPDTGSYTYTPDPDFNGEDHFTVAVDDGHGNLVEAPVKVTVTPEQDAPVLVDANGEPLGTDMSASTPEDTPVSGKLAATDADGDTLTFAKGSDAANGTVTVDVDGNWVYTPNAEFNGNDSFTVIVSDGQGGTDTVTVNITVTAVNDAPMAASESYNTLEDQAVTLDLLANDSDVEDGKPTIQSINGEALTGGAQVIDVEHGQVVIAADGTMQFVPEADYNGAVGVSYVVVDSQGATATAGFGVNVFPVEDAPVVVDPNVPGQNFDPATGETSITTPEDQPVDGQVVATDADGDDLSYTVTEGPSHGTLVIDPDTGAYTYTPDPDFNGEDHFTVAVDDGNGNVVEAPVKVTVTPEQDAPVLLDANGEPLGADMSVSTPEDTPVGGKLSAIDADGDTLTFSKGSDAANGTVTVDAAGNWVYTPNADFNGNDSFTVVVSDGQGGSDEVTVNITVTPVQDAPVVVDPNVPGQNFDPATGETSITTPEDQPVDGQVVATDADGDDLSYTLVDGPSHGTLVIDPDTGGYTYTPDPDFNGEDHFVVTVDDGNGNVVEAPVNVTVTPVQDAPVIVDPNVPGQNFDPATGETSITTPEDQPVDGQVVATDADGDDLSYALVDGPAHGAVVLDPDTGSYTYTPDPDFNGEDHFVVTVDDGHGNVVEAPVNVTVTPVEDAPVIVDPNVPGQNFDPDTGETSITTPEDQPVDGQVVATDADGDDLSYTVTEGPSHGTLVIDPDTGAYTYTPDPDFNGEDHFTVAVDDGNGNVVEAPVNVIVTSVNDAPVARDDHATPQSNTTIGGQLLDNDTDTEGDTLTVVQFAIDTNGDGTSEVVAVPAGGSASAELADASGEPIGSLTIGADGSYSFTPAPGYDGPVPSATYTVSDGADTGSAQLSFDNVPNLSPVVGDESVTVNEDQPLHVPAEVGLLANDSDPEGSILVIVDYTVDGLPGPIVAGEPAEIPGVGTLVIHPDGSYSFTPDAEYSGPVPGVTYTVTDGEGGNTDGHLNLVVNAVNDAPTGGDETVTVPAGGGPLTVGPDEGVLKNDSDTEGDPLVVTEITVDGIPGPIEAGTPVQIPGKGTLVVNPDGSYSFAPETGFQGDLVVSYTVSDGNGGTSTGTLTLQAAGETQNRDDYPFVFWPQDTARGDGGGAQRAAAGLRGDATIVHDAVDAIDSLHGTASIGAEGAVLRAVNGAKSLSGTQALRADGAVLQAVNGVDSLRGIDEGGESALQRHFDASSTLGGFGVAPGAVTSLRLPGNVHLELYTRGAQSWIDVSEAQASGESDITKVSASQADGKALPSWIRVDGHGHIAIDRPAGADVLRLCITVERRGGPATTHVIEIDSNANEMRAVGEPAKGQGADKTRAGGKHAAAASMDFAAQLAQASRGQADADAELMALLG